MKQTVKIFGAIYGGLAVILGALGAHALKSILTTEQLESFQTGVRYQMYHALILLIIGFLMPFSSKIENWIGKLFILGVLLFSFSIYILVLTSNARLNLGFLGPVTPLGGLLLITAWSLLVVYFIKNNK